jgi:uncharacterized protein
LILLFASPLLLAKEAPRIGNGSVKACLSRNVYRHDNGFARQQPKEWEKAEFKAAKKLLYFVRTTMTGLHPLVTGEIVTDVTMLIDDYGLTGVSELIDQNRRGEKSELLETLATEWRGRVDGFFSATGRVDGDIKTALRAQCGGDRRS